MIWLLTTKFHAREAHTVGGNPPPAEGCCWFAKLSMTLDRVVGMCSRSSVAQCRLSSTPKARPCRMVSIRSRQRRDRAPGPCRPRRRGWRGQQWDALVGSAESAIGLHPLAWLERNQRGRRIHVSFLWSVMYRLATSRKHLRTWPRPPPRRPAGGLFHPICLP